MQIDPKKQLEELLQKPMNRKQFLTHVGGALLAGIGVSGMLNRFGNAKIGTPQSPKSPVGNTYGSTSYGGKKT